MSQDTVVVDTSVIVKWLSQDNENYIEQADRVLRDAQLGKVVIIAPVLAKYEAGNVLLLGKHLSVEQAHTVFAQLYRLPVSFVEETDEISDITFESATRAKVTYYDASFMALAHRYDAILVTDNVKHQGKLHEVRTKAIKDY